MAKLPFWMLPASWGLRGKTKKIAEAEYYFKGYDLEVELAKINHDDPDELKKALLDIDLNHKKVTNIEYEKQRATISKEPWVSMPKISWDPINRNKTFFELDYNEYFIQYLKDNGYSGTEDEIMNQWLNDICISVIEEISGLDAALATPSKRDRNNTEQ